MTTQLSRMTVQFKTMGKCRQVLHLAFAFLSRMQGSAVLAHALNDPSVVQESMRQIGPVDRAGSIATSPKGYLAARGFGIASRISVAVVRPPCSLTILLKNTTPWRSIRNVDG